MKNRRSLFQEIFQIQYIFLIIALPIGLYWTVLLPPFQAPDEHVHFLRAYEVSEGHFVSDRVNGQTGNYLPSSLNNFFNKSGTNELPFHYENKIDQKVLEKAKKIHISKERTFFPFPSSAVYSPIPYIPQAFGIFIARSLDFPIYYLLLISRWLNLISFALLSFFAIKIIPRLKKLLFLLTLMPMTLHQASSLSADGMTFGLAFLLTAYIFRLIFSLEVPKVRKRELIVVIFLSVALTLSKSAYFLFFLMLYLIPINKYENKRQYWLYNILASAINVAILFCWMLLTKGTEMPTDPMSQLKTILLNPIGYIKQFIGTFIYDDKLYMQFTGWLGWVDTPLPYIISFLLFIFFTMAIATENRLENENKATYFRGFLLFVFFIMQVGIVATMLYLGWPQSNPKIVMGLQGRYFIPIFLILALSIYVLFPIIKKRYTFYVLVVLFSLAISSYFMYVRYY
jgi:uncharacterized membrane protein